MTTVAYRPLSTAEQIFKDLVWSPAVRIGEIALEGYVPFLALPVIKNLDEFAIEQITNWAFNNLVLLVDITAIRLVNAAHQSAYDSASLQLKIIALDSGIDSQKFKDARDAAKASLSQFTDIARGQ